MGGLPGYRKVRQLNRAGLDLIKQFEGLKFEAYPDLGGVWTIGYGHTGGVRQGQVITQAIADAFLISDLEWACQAVEQAVTGGFGGVPIPTTDNQFAALVSFTYNVGATAFRSSNVLKAHMAGKPDTVRADLLMWNHAGGKVVAGLTRRRKAEGDLYATRDPALPGLATQGVPRKPLWTRLNAAWEAFNA